MDHARPVVGRDAAGPARRRRRAGRGRDAGGLDPISRARPVEPGRRPRVADLGVAALLAARHRADPARPARHRRARRLADVRRATGRDRPGRGPDGRRGAGADPVAEPATTAYLMAMASILPADPTLDEIRAALAPLIAEGAAFDGFGDAALVDAATRLEIGRANV